MGSWHGIFTWLFKQACCYRREIELDRAMWVYRRPIDMIPLPYGQKEKAALIFVVPHQVGTLTS
jgi:hypothetical protein